TPEFPSALRPMERAWPPVGPRGHSVCGSPKPVHREEVEILVPPEEEGAAGVRPSRTREELPGAARHLALRWRTTLAGEAASCASSRRLANWKSASPHREGPVGHWPAVRAIIPAHRLHRAPSMNFGRSPCRGPADS